MFDRPSVFRNGHSLPKCCCVSIVEPLEARVSLNLLDATRHLLSTSQTTPIPKTVGVHRMKPAFFFLSVALLALAILPVHADDQRDPSKSLAGKWLAIAEERRWQANEEG